MKRKPTIQQRLRMKTPDFFRRMGNRFAGAFAGLAASGGAIVLAAQQEGIPETLVAKMQSSGGTLIFVGGLAAAAVKFLSMCVYDENKTKTN